MGRLTLNVLLSFAQFEREVTAEPIRDKIAASKRKGLWMGGSVPLGYQADGRTLKVDENEADTIRELYGLDLTLGNIRDVKERAEDLGLRSRSRERAGGRVTGGKAFDRGHIHHILSNPIYAGRIQHKGRVYKGQHQAIIETGLWEQVQQMLQGTASKTRGSRQKATTSPLAGKLFDETGDRLTPSHSRKNGKRLRYYISHRLVKDRSQKHPDAWRLPAEQLEGLIADLVRQHLSQPDAATSIAQNRTAPEMLSAAERLKGIQNAADCFALVERVDLRPGELTVQLEPRLLAKCLGCNLEQMNQAGLILVAPFQMRRRGVELKLHLGGRCCRTLIAKDSQHESMRLDGADEQARTCPLLHDELVQLQRCAQEARFAPDLAGQRDDLARAA